MVEQPIAVRFAECSNWQRLGSLPRVTGSTPVSAAVNTLVKVLVKVHYEVNGGCFYILLILRLSD